MPKLDIERFKANSPEVVKWFKDNSVESKGIYSLKKKSNISLKHISLEDMGELAPLMSSYYFIIKDLKVLPKTMDFSLLCKVIQMYLGETSMFKVKLYATIMVLIELGM